MSITINDKVYRNIQEQVQKNKEDIARHYEIDRVLANFGIKIVGVVATVNDLPDPLTYPGEYGDAYAVGETGNFTYYIFTRPDYNAGETENHWLDVGRLGIQGPQGAQGPQGEPGPQGEKGSTWYNGTSVPQGADLNKNDQWLNSLNGNVSEYNGQQWILKSNLTGPQGVPGIQGPRGPQGIQGPKGEKGDTGDVGGFINIFGKVNIPEQLPTPSELRNLTAAYLVGTQEPYNLYIQIGPNSETATWNDVGPFNIATLVTVNGISQNVWDADTKLDKATTSSVNNQVYAKNTSGGQYMINIAWNNSADTIALRDGNGCLKTSAPLVGLDAVNKTYLENNAFVKNSTSYPYIPSSTGSLNGNVQENLQFSKAVTPNSIAQREENGELKVAAPVDLDDAVNKNYADTNYVKSAKETVNPNLIRRKAYVVYYNDQGQPTDSTVSFGNSPQANTITMYDGNNCLSTQAPVSGLNCVNKTYAESWSFTRIESSKLTPNKGTASVNSNFGIYVNRATKVFSLTGRITVTNTDEYWTSSPTVNFDYSQISSALGGIVPTRTINIPIICYKKLSDQTDPFVLPEGGQLVFTPTSMYVTLYESVKNYHEPGTIYFHLNATVPYNT